MMRRLFFSCCLTCVAFLHARAQKPGEIKMDTVVVVKDYKPQLADAVKVRTDAALPTLDSAKLKLSYQLNPTLLNLPYTPATLRPIAMTRETDTEPLQNNYIKAGFGTQWSPLLDAHFANGRNDKLNYAVNLFHHSASGAVAHKNFADNRFDAALKFPGKKIAMSLNGGYEAHAVNYYDYNHADSVLHSAPNETFKQRYANVNVGFALENAVPTKSGVGYRWSIGNDYFFTPRGYTLNDIQTGMHVDKTFLTNHTAGFDIGYENINASFAGKKLQYNLVPVHPYYEFRKDIYFARAGLTVVAADTVLVYPDLYGQVNLLNGKVLPFIKIGGFTQKLLLNELSLMNPWINESVTQHVGKAIEASGGVKGAFADRWAYTASVIYRNYDYLPIFCANVGPYTFFTIPYYEEKANETNPHAELAYRVSDKLALTLQGDYYLYHLDFLNPAYGYPDWKIGFGAHYNIQNKILLKADLFARSSTQQLVLENGVAKVVTVKGWVDGNLEAVYNYKQNFGAFVMLSNLTASKYMRWYGYDSYGFGFKAGLILKF